MKTRMEVAFECGWMDGRYGNEFQAGHDYGHGLIEYAPGEDRYGEYARGFLLGREVREDRFMVPSDSTDSSFR